MNHSSKRTDPVKLPYFDYLLALINQNNSVISQSFGRHVHWGYWENPKQASLSTDDFAQAAEALSEEVCNAAHLKNNLTLLDVGCGFGGTIAHINERFSDMHLIGLNLDERQLERARSLVAPLNNNVISFQQGNACALPFPDQSFDVVLAVECIFHFPDRTQFFKEAHRVLKPDGYLALSDFVPSPTLQRLTPVKLPAWRFYGKCHLNYGVNDYQKLAQETHFSIELMRNITDNTLPTYRYLRRLAHQQKVGNSSAMIETLTVEILSRLKWLNYLIYGFQKSDC